MISERAVIATPMTSVKPLLLRASVFCSRHWLAVWGGLLLMACGVSLAHASDRITAMVPSQPPAPGLTPPRVQALLEQAWAEQAQSAPLRDDHYVAGLYCEAARQGVPEAHLRAGLWHLNAGTATHDVARARAFLMAAQELGHPDAELPLRTVGPGAHPVPACLTQDEPATRRARPDFQRQLALVAPARRSVLALVQRLAPEYGVQPELAVAIAAVESNFNPQALSPKQAQGVMQLIPATAERFGVRDVWHPEDNIRGGLAYLRWLMRRFNHDMVRVVAAYNAGEGAVDRHGGVPPYAETRAYVARVMAYAGGTPSRP